MARYITIRRNRLDPRSDVALGESTSRARADTTHAKLSKYAKPGEETVTMDAKRNERIHYSYKSTPEELRGHIVREIDRALTVTDDETDALKRFIEQLGNVVGGWNPLESCDDVFKVVARMRVIASLRKLRDDGTNLEDLTEYANNETTRGAKYPMRSTSASAALSDGYKIAALASIAEQLGHAARYARKEGIDNV